MNELREMVEDGDTISEIAATLGITYNAVRGRLRRAKLKVTQQSCVTIRMRVDKMKPLDAVEYLLGVVEEYSSVSPIGDHEVDSWRRGFTASERRLLIALVDAGETGLTKDSCYTALYFDVVDADSLPQLKIVDVFLCKARSKIPANVGSILTDWGRGYRFERATHVSKEVINNG